MSPILLLDSSGKAWQVGVDDNGLLTTTQVPGTAPTAIILNDNVISQTWKLLVLTTGLLQVTATSASSNPKQLHTSSADGAAWVIQIASGLLQTAPDTSCGAALQNVNVGVTSNYKWLTLAQARNALSARLADPSNKFWSVPELNLYLVEALRTWNALTEIWNVDVTFDTCGLTWYNFGTLSGSPRQRTVTDAYLYTVMQYHLLEQPTGAGTWGGTSQFTLADLQFALQRARDEMIQVSGCNLDNFSLPYTANTIRTNFADTVLEPRRIRVIGVDSSAATMTREDTLAFDSFEANHRQNPATPQAWSVVTGPPLAMDVDTAPRIPGFYDVISLQSGPVFNPPAATVLAVPNDWSWVAKWGALADLLGRESEATDRQRADYCMKRYQDGLKIMRQSNWIVAGKINGFPCDTPSMREMDGFSPEWQGNPKAWPGIVVAGMDFAAPCPVGSMGITMTVVANAPIPVNDTDFVQVSRDSWEAILGYAQVLAAFKMGGTDFTSTKDMEINFFTFAADTNKRLLKDGLFLDTIRGEGNRQNVLQPR